MPTPAQIRIVQIARQKAGLDEPRYRLLLRNVAGVVSATQLDNAGVEDVMAVMEDLGFKDFKGDRYWRNKVTGRGTACGERMLFKIRQLATNSRYPLESMVRRFTQGNTDQVEQLTPRQAWQLIEAYKAIEQREGGRDSSSGQGSLFARTEAPAQGAPAATDGGTGSTLAARPQAKAWIDDGFYEEPPF